MGNLCVTADSRAYETSNIQNNKKRVDDIDMVKMKLKLARDKINYYLRLKNKDMEKIEAKINDKIPVFKENGDKKELLPLLRAKKEIMDMIEKGELRKQIVYDKISEVEMAKVNQDTITVLEESNGYIKKINDDLYARDWRKVLYDAYNRVQVYFPNTYEEDLYDPAFLAMWNEVGGNKIQQAQQPAQKKVHIEVPEKEKQTQQARVYQHLA